MATCLSTGGRGNGRPHNLLKYRSGAGGVQTTESGGKTEDDKTTRPPRPAQLQGWGSWRHMQGSRVLGQPCVASFQLSFRLLKGG